MAEITSQDLTHETLLQRVGRMQVGAYRQPALGGIPLLTKIGQGESGGCYRATHPTLDRDVAVKIIPYNPDARSERFGMFLANARAAISVDSPHLVKVFEVGTEADVFFQVMEVVAGRSAQHQLALLRERLKPGMDEVAVLDLCIAASEGLAAAHAAGFVHRDIRPSSILIPNGENSDTPQYAHAKLADLGLAFNEASGRLLEGSPAETGTPGFMSPEEAVGSKDISAASDIFSMGATMYNLLVGQPPFGGPSLAVVLSSTVIHDSNDLRTWRPDVSRATNRVVEGCLKKSASARFQNASVLLNALKIARAAYNGTVEAQADAVKQIEALLPSIAQLDPAIKNFLANAEPMPIEPAPALPDEATVVGGKLSFPAAGPAATPVAEVAPAEAAAALAKELVSAAPAAAPANVPPVPEAAVVTIADQSWEDPAQAEVVNSAPARRRSAMPVLMAAALLMIAAAGGAWRLGFLGKKKAAVALANGPDKLARDKAEQEARTKAEKAEKDRQEALAKAKADADAKAKAEADAKAKEEADKLAAARKAADEKAAAAAAAKAAKEKDEADARLRQQAKEKEEAEARQREEADARRKREADAKLKQQQEDDARKQAEAKKAAEAAKLAEAQKAKEIERKKIAEAAAHSAQAQREREAAAANTSAAGNQGAIETKVAEAKAKAGQEAMEARRLGDNSKPAAPAPAPAAVPTELPKQLTLELGSGIRMDFVLVPAGNFQMGTNRDTLHDLCRKAQADEKDYADEIPAHRVDVAAFYIAKTPVTIGQFRAFVSATQYRTAAERRGEAYTLADHNWQLTPGASWMKPGFEQGEEHPVVNLSWRDCNVFAEWASKQCGKALRLPTESEWEYAARGPKSSTYPWGNSWDGRRANHSDQRLHPFGPRGWSYSSSDDGFAFTAPVGVYNNRSWCGALDMAGNVFQWCLDAYSEYPQSQSPNAPEIIVDPGDISASAKRPVRGGSYLFRPIDCRSAARRSLSPNAWSYELGMRLAFTPK